MSNSAASFLKALLAAARSEASRDPDAAAAAAAAVTASSLGAGSDTTAAAAGGGEDASGAGGGSQAHAAWAALWRRPLLAVLYGGDDKLRSYVTVHGLPAVLGLDPGSAVDLIRAILADPDPEPVPGTSRVAALVCVLKVARVCVCVLRVWAWVGVGGGGRASMRLAGAVCAAFWPDGDGQYMRYGTSCIHAVPGMRATPKFRMCWAVLLPLLRARVGLAASLEHAA